MPLKNGSPLNEARILCHSILANGDVLRAEKTIRFKPERSVLKLQFGDEIRLDQEVFRADFRAFFVEIETKFR